MTDETYLPDKPTHPGVTLRGLLTDLYLLFGSEEYESPEKFAFMNGLNVPDIMAIANSKKGIDKNIADRLDEELDIPAIIWLSLQHNYDLAMKQVEEAEQPTIICLCGSTKFKQAYIDLNRRLTLEGNIVLSVGLFGHQESNPLSKKTKMQLDELHLRKIDLCSIVYVVDVGGYIGKSTRREIEYAINNGKCIKYLSRESEQPDPHDEGGRN